MMTQEQLLEEYLSEFKRTTGRTATVVKSKEMWKIDTGHSRPFSVYSVVQLHKMLMNLKTRPTFNED